MHRFSLQEVQRFFWTRLLRHTVCDTPGEAGDMRDPGKICMRGLFNINRYRA